ncbi:TPA: conjugal transfer protein TraG N-terminal domain-containing protein [Escherichia coli]|nr:TraX family protein [Escherichia coli]HBL4937250.1 conjugal transfer protein TraG N-terminal domain-containing protein [Escherichia coli]
MNEVYVIAGGEWLRNNLNAIAAFMGTRTWDSIEKIALTLSVLAVAVMWVQRHNVMDLLGWVAGLVMTVLTVGLVSCAGKSLPRFWPGDFFPVFYACHLAVLGVLAL